MGLMKINVPFLTCMRRDNVLNSTQEANIRQVLNKYLQLL